MRQMIARISIPCLAPLAALVACLACGCDDRTQRRQAPQPDQSEEEAATSDDADPPLPFPPQTPNAPSQAVDGSAARAGESSETPIRLSAGVALPQSLPAGTAMGFSVDYKFTADGPQPGDRYVWVIRAAGADEPWEQEVSLQAGGTLQTFVPDWRPDEGPFDTFVAETSPDGDRRPLSAIEPLAEDGR